MASEGSCTQQWEQEYERTFKPLYTGINVVLLLQLLVILGSWIAMLRKYNNMLSRKYKVTIWCMISMIVLVPMLYFLSSRVDIESNQKEIYNLIIYRVLSAFCDYIFYAFIIKLRGIFLLLQMDRYDSFEQFYSRVTNLKILYWACLIAIIVFNFSYIAFRSIEMAMGKKTASDLTGIDEKTIIYSVFTVQSLFLVFHVLMNIFYVSTTTSFVNITGCSGCPGEGQGVRKYKVWSYIVATVLILGKVQDYIVVILIQVTDFAGPDILGIHNFCKYVVKTYLYLQYFSLSEPFWSCFGMIMLLSLLTYIGANEDLRASLCISPKNSRKSDCEVQSQATLVSPKWSDLEKKFTSRVSHKKSRHGPAMKSMALTQGGTTTNMSKINDTQEGILCPQSMQPSNEFSQAMAQEVSLPGQPCGGSGPTTSSRGDQRVRSLRISFNLSQHNRDIVISSNHKKPSSGVPGQKRLSPSSQKDRSFDIQQEFLDGVDIEQEALATSEPEQKSFNNMHLIQEFFKMKKELRSQSIAAPRNELDFGIIKTQVAKDFFNANITYQVSDPPADE